jgi:hypothetical protein
MTLRTEWTTHKWGDLPARVRESIEAEPPRGDWGDDGYELPDDPACGCRERHGKWTLCDYHEGFRDAVETVQPLDTVKDEMLTEARAERRRAALCKSQAIASYRLDRAKRIESWVERIFSPSESRRTPSPTNWLEEVAARAEEYLRSLPDEHCGPAARALKKTFSEKPEVK